MMYELQDSLKKVQAERSMAFSSKKDILAKIGNFRWVLCARKDIEIRRKLYKVDTVSDVQSKINSIFTLQQKTFYSTILIQKFDSVFSV